VEIMRTEHAPQKAFFEVNKVKLNKGGTVLLK
jgi:hypothetical protein